jgi:hypothetical protein
LQIRRNGRIIYPSLSQNLTSIWPSHFYNLSAAALPIKLIQLAYKLEAMLKSAAKTH